MVVVVVVVMVMMMIMRINRIFVVMIVVATTQFYAFGVGKVLHLVRIVAAQFHAVTYGQRDTPHKRALGTIFLKEKHLLHV